MIKISTLYLLLTLCFSLLIASVAQAEDRLFRYKNDQGSPVVSDSISPYYAAKGYEVIGSRGTVLEIIPRELSPEKKIQQRKDRQIQATLDAWDEELTSRYHSVEDIQSTQARRLKGIDNSITSLKLTLENISDTKKYYQSEAAANERQGEVVATDTLTSMARLQKDRGFIQKEIDKRQASREKIIEEFKKDIERFRIISPPS
ncbi:MAG: cell fate (sporulation/competence/biofilm development) regulator YmcA (YheA/YmcA/DUF963 family) [Candidatus Endobugula sp.]|jgi:cell fate (sporulation/competence/biofilm development) regulator YmcA (YheA/YmcA/DUF963 family)